MRKRRKRFSVCQVPGCDRPLGRRNKFCTACKPDGAPRVPARRSEKPCAVCQKPFVGYEYMRLCGDAACLVARQSAYWKAYYESNSAALRARHRERRAARKTP